MADEVLVYISIMKDSLQEKTEVLQEILALTQKQECLLKQVDMDSDAFDETLDRKEQLIRKMQELDRGFEGLYKKIEPAVKSDMQRYKPQILELQNLIRVLTDYGVKIQALEHKNKTRFMDFAAAKRKEIQAFHVKSKTANAYHNNMANQHNQWQSYFMDQKK